MEVLRRRPPIHDVEVCEAGPFVGLGKAWDTKRGKYRLVEADALSVVGRVDVDVIDDDPRPVPALDGQEYRPPRSRARRAETACACASSLSDTGSSSSHSPVCRSSAAESSQSASQGLRGRR